MSQTTQPPAKTDVDDKEDQRPRPPRAIRGNNLTARVIRQKIWRRANVENDWCVFVIVGREGSGKSLTCASILERVDPGFDASRIHFDPVDFLEEIDSDSTDTGDAVMLDESGVGLGNRTWYDRGQIEFNQLMQTARDDNMIVGLTLPRLEELDIQMQGRLHALLEMQRVDEGRYAEFKFKNVKPSRDGRDQIRTPFPKLRVNGRTRKVRKLALGPPSDDLAAAYEERKAEFKRELYSQTKDTLSDDEEDDEMTPKDIAEEILAEDRVEEYVQDNNGQRYLDRDLLKIDYDIGEGQSKTVKKQLLRESDIDAM